MEQNCDPNELFSSFQEFLDQTNTPTIFANDTQIEIACHVYKVNIALQSWDQLGRVRMVPYLHMEQKSNGVVETVQEVLEKGIWVLQLRGLHFKYFMPSKCQYRADQQRE